MQTQLKLDLHLALILFHVWTVQNAHKPSMTSLPSCCSKCACVHGNPCTCIVAFITSEHHLHYFVLAFAVHCMHEPAFSITVLRKTEYNNCHSKIFILSVINFHIERCCTPLIPKDSLAALCSNSNFLFQQYSDELPSNFGWLITLKTVTSVFFLSPTS